MDDKQIDYRKYIKQPWIRNHLHTYELLRRLRDDNYFRGLWVENQIKIRIKAEPSIDVAEYRDLILAYLNEFDFRICKNKQGRPSTHISPKTFRGQSWSRILGLSSCNLSICLNLIVESAVDDVIKCYGKGSILSSIFGSEFNRLFNSYIIRRMKKEFGKG